MLSFARVRALAIVAVLIVVAAVVVYQALDRDQQVEANEAGGCTAGFVYADLTLHDANEIKINVYNGTNRSGVAGQVGEHFSNRGFEVLDHDDANDSELAEEVALLRYGPASVGAAHVVNAYFLNHAVLEFQIDRVDLPEGVTEEDLEELEDDEWAPQIVVDVVIGPGFRQLATETEVRQAIANAGSPGLPPGTCRG